MHLIPNWRAVRPLHVAADKRSSSSRKQIFGQITVNSALTIDSFFIVRFSSVGNCVIVEITGPRLAFLAKSKAPGCVQF